MNRIDFEWQVGGESGEWETIAESKKRPRGRRSWRVWVVVAAVLIVVAAVAFTILRQRFEEANQQITFQLENVIDLETKAWNRGNVDLYLRQQDDFDLDWYAQQSRLVNAKRTQGDVGNIPTVKIQEVNVQGDVAWVETIEGNEPVRRMRFYRQTDRGWLHTAPDPRFWDQAIEYHYGDQIVFRYHERDQPYIDPLVEQLGTAFYDICMTVHCEGVFEVNFIIDTPAVTNVPERTVLVLSPWTFGLPLEGEWGETAAESALYDLALRILRSRFSNPPPAQNSLTSAIMSEYAVWVSTGDLTQSPLLGRVIARQGRDILPELFESLDREPTLGEFVGRWLFFAPTTQDRAVVFFETLLNVEQEAFLTGRRETFLLLQDSEELIWINHQEYIFDRVTDQERESFTFPPVEIKNIMVYQDYAVIMSDLPDILRSRSVTIFILRNGEWKHNDFSSPSYGLPPLPTATPSPGS
ncbi:MAG: hypothetical protein JXA89_01800 [Anaerolineae bacterium]|nr:hypothetical protein [Anaerolineae bacterium]